MSNLILTDAGFENGPPPSSAWTCYTEDVGLGASVVTVDGSLGPHTGTYFLRLFARKVGPTSGGARRIVSVPIGKMLRFSGWVEGQGVYNVAFMFYDPTTGLSSFSTSVNFQTGIGVWTPFTLPDFEAKSSSLMVDIYLYAPTIAGVTRIRHFDDLVLEEVVTQQLEAAGSAKSTTPKASPDTLSLLSGRPSSLSPFASRIDVVNYLEGKPSRKP